MMRLVGLPTPPGTGRHRVRMTDLFFCCRAVAMIEVEDLGFGELCRTRPDMVWKREIHVLTEAVRMKNL